MHQQPEPWMRGPIPGVDPLIAPVLYSFQQAAEDLAKHTEGLIVEQIWAQPYRFGSVGFHLRHIAGSTTRLMAYLQGRQLHESELADLAREAVPSVEGRDQLLAAVDHSFQAAERIIRALPTATLAEPREVGRQRLPTTVIGLLTHIAEHTQRHVGQAISAAKLVRVSGKG
jgi:uncharacterized damage-inducible protein DinB